MSSSTQLEDMSSSTTTELNPANPYPKLPKVRGDLRSLVRRIGFRKWVKQVEFLNEECGGITRSQAQHEWKRLLLKKKKLYGGSTEQKRRLLEEGNVQAYGRWTSRHFGETHDDQGMEENATNVMTGNDLDAHNYDTRRGLFQYPDDGIGDLTEYDLYDRDLAIQLQREAAQLQADRIAGTEKLTPNEIELMHEQEKLFADAARKNGGNPDFEDGKMMGTMTLAHRSK